MRRPSLEDSVAFVMLLMVLYLIILFAVAVYGEVRYGDWRCTVPNGQPTPSVCGRTR